MAVEQAVQAEAGQDFIRDIVAADRPRAVDRGGGVDRAGAFQHRAVCSGERSSGGDAAGWGGAATGFFFFAIGFFGVTACRST